jgi:hypothetical protein
VFRIQDVPGSNLCPETGCARGFLRFYSVCPGKSLNCCHDLLYDVQLYRSEASSTFIVCYKQLMRHRETTKHYDRIAEVSRVGILGFGLQGVGRGWHRSGRVLRAP